ncbi:MAG: hypothetical protein ABI207_01945 [Crocinitomicaceae bacterium]
MKINIPYLLCFILIFSSCTNNNPKKAECDCSLLSYDDLYNHFYETDREVGYTGKCIAYYPGGKIKTKRTIVNGKNDGPYSTYFPSGKIQEEGSFKENLQHGIRKIYDEKGQLVSEETFFYGQLKLK